MSIYIMLEFIKNRIFATIAVAVVVLYFAVLRHDSAIHDNLLTGFWKAPADFLTEVQLDSFVVYIGSPDWKGSRACYLLAEKNGQLVINEPATVYIQQTWAIGNFSLGLGEKTYTATFHDTEIADSEFPKKQQLAFYPHGKLVLSANTTIYGVFFKDATLTDTML